MKSRKRGKIIFVALNDFYSAPAGKGSVKKKGIQKLEAKISDKLSRHNTARLIEDEIDNESTKLSLSML